MYPSMKTRLLLFLFCISAIAAMGQGTVTRNKCKTCGKAVAQCPYKGQHPKPTVTTQSKSSVKPIPKSAAKSKQEPVPAPEPEAAGYDVTFTCNVPSASLTIEGTSYGAVDGTRFLKTGTHSVKLTAEGYEDLVQTINVNRQHTSFQLTMTKKAGPSVTYQNNVLRVGELSYRMVYVAGGTFTMGATKEMKKPADNEKPTHQVTLSNYYIGETEVTQALWKAVMGSNPSKFKGDDLPVECVSWNDCQTFINKLNELTGQRFSLPTEAEWEFAARGGNQSRHTQYSGSDNIDEVAWYRENSGGQTHPVKTKKPNELGLYDMTGNVYEWCQDWFGPYSSAHRPNPMGAGSGSRRVNRGSSWDGPLWYGRVSCRGDRPPGVSGYNLGLRLVLFCP